MNWDDLRIVVALAKNGTVQKTANELGVNATTVTRRLAQLETDLQAQLFSRLRTGYQITEAGRVLLVRAHAMNEQAVAIEQEVLGQDSALTGKVRLTASEDLLRSFLMKDLLAFSKDNPGIELQIYGSYQHASLSLGEADIAVRITANPPEALVGRRVSDMAVAVYASQEFLAAAGELRGGKRVAVIGEADSEGPPTWLPTWLGQAKVTMRCDKLALTVQALSGGHWLGAHSMCSGR